MEARLKEYSTARIRLIEQSIFTCCQELFIDEESICVYALGSLSSETSIPSSDFEFGILTSSEVDRNSMQGFLTLLEEKLLSFDIHFDAHHTHPQFNKYGKRIGSIELNSTPEQLIEILQKNRVTFAYPFYCTKFIYGNEELYQRFTEGRANLLILQKRTFLKELRFTRKKNGCIHYLKGKINGSEFDTPINFKKHLFRPVVDLLSYLSFFNSVSLDTPFMQLSALVTLNVLTQEEAQRIFQALLFAFNKRFLNNDHDSTLKNLSPKELELLYDHWDTIYFLTEKVRQCAFK